MKKKVVQKAVENDDFFHDGFLLRNVIAVMHSDRTDTYK